MKRFLLLVTLALCALALIPAAPAQAAQTSKYQFQGLAADAYFSTVDETGCIINEVSVSAADGRTKTGPGKPDAAPMAYVFLVQYNQCTEELLSFAQGATELNAGAFQIDRQFNAATLNTTVVVTDEISGETYPVAVNVAFTGSGPTFRDKSRYQSSGPGYKYTQRFDGTFRQATASGSVTTPDGTNLTPEPAVFAQLGSVRSGVIEIVKE